ncbi:hypothetical protein [Bradyrhizobium sp. USDA 4350]
MTPMRFSVDEKLKEIDRELMQRHRVYRRLIERGKLKRDTAARQIAIMTDIANDYREKIKDGPLFNFNRPEGEAR